MKGTLLFFDNKSWDFDMNAINHFTNDRIFINKSKFIIESTLWHVVFVAYFSVEWAYRVNFT